MTVRKVIEATMDALRFVGALFYWNARKTAYVARGRRGRCPCQNESDDSVPGRVRCDATLLWHRPGRFRPICPLLVSTPDGWRCSVHATQVRPFWGRALVWMGAIVAVLYLGGVFTVFGFLRLAGGAPVTLAQVAWPGRWSEIRAAQSQYLFQRAIGAFAHGRLSEAYVALLSAQQRDPDNYDSALMLAQIAMFQGSAIAADQQFERLLREHPAQAERTAIVYHDTLLSLDRSAALARFSLVRAKDDSAHAAVWVRSALLAVRALPRAEAVELREKAEADLSALAPHAQILLQAAFDARAGETDEALRRLRAPLSGPLNPFYARQQVLLAAELGDVLTAQVLLDYYGPPCGEFEQQLAQFELSSLARDEDAAEIAFRRLLAQPLQETRVERIAAALVARPSAARYRQLSARVRREPALEAACDGAGLWAVGLACGVPNDAAYWRSRGRQPLLAGYPAIRSIDFSSSSLAIENSVCHLMNVLPLPREIILALLARVERHAALPRAGASFR